MSEERIMTLHPEGKKGVHMLLSKYTRIREFILHVLHEQGTIRFEDLTERAVRELQPSFEGKVVWYIVSVKLDLEARGIIERVPKTSPHELRLVQ